jgi:hypothetical protein
MTSAQALSLASTVLKNNSEKAAPLLLLLNALLDARGDPLEESIVLDVKRYIYSRTEHSEQGMELFISEAAQDSSGLAA